MMSTKLGRNATCYQPSPWRLAVSFTTTIHQRGLFCRVVALKASVLLVGLGVICQGNFAAAQHTSVQADAAQVTPVASALTPATWKRISSIDVKHISLDLSCDWSNQKLLGTCTIRLSLLQPSDRIALDSGDLQIQSITLEGGGQLKFDNHSKDGLGNLVVYLERKQAAEKDLTLQIKYRTGHINQADPNNIWGSFGKGVRFQEPTSATPIKRRQAWSSGEPEANRYWFPGHESASDLRTTDIRISVDKGYSAIATGELVGIEDRSNNQRVFHYRATTPHPNFLTALAIGEYVRIEQAQDGVELHTYGYADEKEAIEASVVRLPEMLSYFATATGHKYPFQRFTQVVVQDCPFPGRVGQHGSVIVSDNMIDDERTHADFFYLWDGVEAQGLASQWFGNLIVPKDWSHAWLSLSFSRYMDALFNMHKNGMDEYLIYHADFEHTTVMADWQVGYRHPIVTEQFADLEEFVTDNHAKYRGALVLHMLRKVLGEEKWWQAFRSYVKTFANKLVSTADMQRCFEESTGQDLGWFFDQWLYRMGHPLFEISKTYDQKRRQLTITVRQTQTTDASNPYPQVEFFRGSIDLEIDKRVERVWIKPQPENSFIFNMETAPGFVHFDYQNVWITTTSLPMRS